MTIGVHIRLGDVTGSQLATRSQIAVADLVAVLLVIRNGATLVSGPIRRWVVLAGWLAVNCMVFGVLNRYTVVNKIFGLVLLTLACSAIVRELNAAGRTAYSYTTNLFVNVVAIEAVVAIVVLFAAPSLVLPVPIPLNFDSTRVSAFMVDPNAFGGLASLALMLSVGFRRLHGSHWRLPAREIALLAAIALTYSRTVWGATAVGCVFLVVRSSTGARVRAAAVVAAAAVILLSFNVTLPVDQDLVTRGFTIEQRTSGAQQAFVEWKESPALGIGLGQYVEGHGFIIHNTPLWALTELGIVGFALLAYCSLGVLEALRRVRRVFTETYLGLCAALISMTILSLGIEALYQRYVWLLLALVYAAGKLPSAAGEMASSDTFHSSTIDPHATLRSPHGGG